MAPAVRHIGEAVDECGAVGPAAGPGVEAADREGESEEGHGEDPPDQLARIHGYLASLLGEFELGVADTVRGRNVFAGQIDPLGEVARHGVVLVPAAYEPVGAHRLGAEAGGGGEPEVVAAAGGQDGDLGDAAS